LATDAGLDVLESGGNAFDAAVAVAAMLNVVEPMMSGIGGYGTILVYDAAPSETWFLNPSGRIPAAVDSDVYREPTPGYRQNRRGAKAVSTPGNANAWEAMWERYGRLDWRVLFNSAIKTARDGFALDERTARSISRAYSSFPPHAQEFYGKDGSPLEAGDLLVQRDLARSFQLLATYGAAVVHGGGLGLAIHDAMREAEGFLSIDDLAGNEAEWWEPIGITYRGYEVLTAAPPANSFPALVRLGMMSMYDPTELGHNTTEYLHAFAEVTKHGFWTRLRWAGDPEVKPPPLETLFSEVYWRDEVAKIDPNRAKPFEPPTSFSNGDFHTTHFVVADQWGNVVSATQTLGNAFGSRIMPEGTGIWLNNSLAYCTFEPKGNPMDAFPGRHKLSGDVPLFVMRDGKPWFVIGTPGGHTIGQTIPQIVMNAVDFGMDIQTAITAPRISFYEPDSLAVETAIPEHVRNELSAMGHKIGLTRGLGVAHGLVIEYDAVGRPIRFFGGADPRGSGSARGR
jgi:gamma-glutamyltranspeptidase/glutathione hydrolase